MSANRFSLKRAELARNGALVAVLAILLVSFAHLEVNAVNFTVYAGSHFRKELDALIANAGGSPGVIQSITASTGNHPLPAWMKRDLLPLVYGKVPNFVRGDVLGATVLMRASSFQPILYPIHIRIIPIGIV